MMVVESANITSWATTQFSGRRIYRSPTCCMPFSSNTTRWALYFLPMACSSLVEMVCWSMISM